jgi:uncharacterized protein (TIGR02246 family)
MLRYLVTIAAGLAVCAVTNVQAATLEETLFDQEMKLCNAVAKKDTKAFTELVAPNAVIAEKGKLEVAQREGLAAHVDDVNIESFKLLDPKVVQVTDDVAILSFNTDVNATENGKKLPARNHVSTTFAKRDGKWLVVYTTSYPLGN